MAKKRNHGTGAGPEHPVSQVDWHEATAFCARAGKRAGVAIRLPTEAEMEYATRASSKTPTYLGTYAQGAALAGWHHDNSEQRTHPVGGKTPNAWGLYDMLGNVWNWCDDGPREYTSEEVTDPRGPDGGMRNIKGASYKSLAFRCRSAARYPYADHYTFDDLGFRVVVAHE